MKPVSPCIVKRPNVFNAPVPSSMFNKKPSQAEPNLVTSPAKLSKRISAISAAAPAAPSNLSCSSAISCRLLAKTKSAGPPLLPANSIAVKSLSEDPAILSNPSSKVRPFFFNSMNEFFKAVPASLPFILESDKTPKRAPVLSIVSPNAFAAGAAFENDSLNVVKSCAELTAVFAITSTTLCVSVVSSPNALMVPPANDAASAKSTSKDAAKSNIEGVASPISITEKPSFASSVCRLTTCDAVNAVVLPNSFACAESCPISSLVAPATALSPEIAFE